MPQPTIRDAIELARQAHAGQTDKAGKLYFGHLERVMDSVNSEDLKMIAVLHDSLEDTSVSAEYLREAGYAEHIISAIEALTKRPDEEGTDEGYMRFIRRAAQNPLARVVKMADLRDNMDLARIANPTVRDRERIAKYRRALNELEAMDDSEANKMTKPRLHLLPVSNTVAASEVLSVADTERLFACDFAITGAQAWHEKPWGYEHGRLINIDHHAPTPRMRACISSTNLAIIHVQENGIADLGDTVVINHTDCDSVLSAAIMRADLEPLHIFGQAAIAADHTGEENDIADLLQALDKKRDYEYSLHNLRLLMDGKALDADAQARLEKRCFKRAKAAELVQSGAFTVENGVAWAVLDDAIDGEFFPALLPDTVLIAMFSPRQEKADENGSGRSAAGEVGVKRWNAKIRLGNAAPEDFSLPNLIAPLDAGYGGRWNAGSNKRAGGSSLSPQEYVAALTGALVA